MHLILRESSGLDGGVNLHREEFVHIMHIVDTVVTMLLVVAVLKIMMLGRCV